MLNSNWLVYNCTDFLLKLISDKQFIVIRNDFGGMFCTFIQPIDSLSNYTQHEQLTFGHDFDQPIDVLS